MDQKAQVVGCIEAEMPENHPEFGLHPKSALMGLLAVHPDYQSRGIGRQLLKESMKYVHQHRGVEQAIMWVIQQRKDIQAWYERMQFKWTGETKDFVLPDKALKNDVYFKIYSRDLADLSGQ